jgi:hypothetical protein
VANASQHGPSQRSSGEEKHAQGSSQRPQAETSTAGAIVNMVTERAKDLASGASAIASEAKETFQEWSSAAGEAAGQAEHKAQKFATSAAHQAENFSAHIVALIRRYPMPALLLGFGAGFVLGQMRRR